MKARVGSVSTSRLQFLERFIGWQTPGRPPGQYLRTEIVGLMSSSMMCLRNHQSLAERALSILTATPALPTARSGDLPPAGSLGRH